MLGKRSVHAAECFASGFVGTDFGIVGDLTAELTDSWKEFNAKYIPVFLESRPDKSRVAAGLACGAIWTVSKGLDDGDFIVSPDGASNYRVGRINGPYYYAAGPTLPHRRPVIWLEGSFPRAAMSDALRHSSGSIGTVSDLTQYATEIQELLQGAAHVPTVTPDLSAVFQDPVAFAMERHLEDFLVENWPYTPLGKTFDIYTVDGEVVGQQFPTDTGPLDILAISKDRKTLLVVELKRGRASDDVVGQILRYMGYVQDELAEPGQSVRGAIVALDDDQRIRRALRMTPAIEFFRYKVSFDLVKGEQGGPGS